MKPSESTIEAPLPTLEKLQTEEKVRKIFKICLTGGPCAGKTSSLNHLKERFSPNFIVYVLPEVAATTVGAGVTIIPSEFTPETHKIFTVKNQNSLYRLSNFFLNFQKSKFSDFFSRKVS